METTYYGSQVRVQERALTDGSAVYDVEVSDYSGAPWVLFVHAINARRAQAAAVAMNAAKDLASGDDLRPQFPPLRDEMEKADIGTIDRLLRAQP